MQLFSVLLALNCFFIEKGSQQCKHQFENSILPEIGFSLIQKLHQNKKDLSSVWRIVLESAVEPIALSTQQLTPSRSFSLSGKVPTKNGIFEAELPNTRLPSDYILAERGNLKKIPEQLRCEFPIEIKKSFSFNELFNFHHYAYDMKYEMINYLIILLHLYTSIMIYSYFYEL